jgi:hypothetical protein
MDQATQDNPTTASNPPVIYPERVYNGKDFEPNLNREQSSDNLTTVLTDKNEVLGFPDNTSKQEMQAAIEADRNGSISTYKPTFYDKYIQGPLSAMGMDAFQPKFVTDIKPSPERAFATSMARAATADVFKPVFSDEEAKAYPGFAFAGSLVGSIAAFGTGGALLDGFKMSQLTPFAENIIKGGVLGGAYKGVSETSNELRDQDHPDLAKIGTGVLHDALWWGGISGLAGAASKPVGVAASAGLGYLMAKSEGADEPSALLNGAVLGGFHLLQAHGDQLDVKQFVTDKLQSNIADYILAKNPMVHPIVADQAGRELISNYAEDVIERHNQRLAGVESPQAVEIEKTENGLPITGIESPAAKAIEEGQKLQFQRPEVPIEDGYDPKLLDYLSNFIPAKTIARMSGTDRTALGKESEETLNEYKSQYEQLQAIIAGEKAEGQKPVIPEVEKMISEGSPIIPLDEAAKSQTVLNEVMKNVTQQVMLKEGEENAGERGESLESGSGQETSEGQAQAGVHLRDDAQGGMEAKAGEEVVNHSNDSSSTLQSSIRQEESQGKNVESPAESLDGKEGTSTTKEVTRKTEEGEVSSKKSITPEEIESKYKGLSDDERTSFKEQAKLASDLINTDIEKARRILRGEESLPGKLQAGGFLSGMEEYIKKNPNDEIINELADTNLYKENISKGAQATSLSRMLEENSFSSKMNEINRAKVDAVGGDEKIAKSKKSAIDVIKKEMKKNNLDKDLTKWDNFWEDNKC